MFRRLPASLLPSTLVASGLLLALSGLVGPGAASAAQEKAAKPAKQASVSATSVKKASTRQAKASKAAPAAAAGAVDVAAADEKQMLAAKEVFMGECGCEFGQKIRLDANSKHPGYVDLSFNKRTYTMKPVMSPTGALRLEDVGGEALMIQIANKTMVMNQKTGQRMIDNCVHPSQKTETAESSQALIK
jgi:hypothetical protein